MGTAGLWRGEAPLVLASTSPTRRGLLEGAGLSPAIEAPGVDERAVEAEAQGLPPPDLAARLAKAKALAVSRRRRSALVVGADQVLACEGEVFHKPADRAAARAQLLRLAGRTHALHAAVCIAQGGEVRRSFVESARLTLRPLTPEAIDRYLDQAGDGALASVGAYQVEGPGIHLFERIEGDHATILGLPLLPLLAALRDLDCLAF